MNRIFRQLILLWTLFFSNFLYADGTDVSITVSNAHYVYETNGTLKFTINLSEAPLFNIVTVNYETVNGSAKAGEDYNAISGSVIFYPFQNQKTIEVSTINDDRHESKEYLYLSISNSDNGYVVTDSRGVGYIYDDDTAPLKAKIHNRYEKEKDSNWILNFTVKLNKYAPDDITLNYTTIDNSAKAGEDYIESNGTITIPKGSRYGHIPITILADTMPEGREYFNVKISSISEGSIVRDTARGTIVDDDVIKVYMDSSDINEGDSGDSNKMAFRVYLKKDYPLDSPLTIHYETQDGSSTPSASSNSDYIAKSGDITFNKGDKETIIYVDIVGDEEIEDNEFLQMNLSGSSYIVTTKSQSLILNDDGEYPSLSFSTTNYSIVEGNSSQSNLDFTFTLNTPALDSSSFHYETYNNTAEDENGDNDYIYTHGDKILVEGTTSFTISVPINGDTKIEDDESFYFSISNLNKLNYGTTSRATGTILNDDGEYPTLSFTKDSFSIDEGNSSQKDMNFTLTLDLPAMENSYFDYYTQNGSAIGSEDFEAISRTTFNIPKGEQNITIPIKIIGDTSIEDNENFYLIIDNESENLKISGTQSPKGIIINDDGSFPKIDIEKDSYSTEEGDSSSHKLDIKLVLDKPALEDSSIDYYTKDKEAQDGSSPTEDSDYIESSGTIDISKGSTSATIKLTINEDTNIEPNEDFQLYITNSKNLTIGRDSSTITILNDDIHNEEPFICDKYMYLSSSIKRGSKTTGKMWLHKIDITKSPFGFEVLDDAGEDKLYNALAYNEKDNYIYGLYYKELFKISKSGKVMSLGEVTGLPDLLATKQVYAGASYNGYYYVTGFGVDYDKVYKIKLSDNDAERVVEDINLTTPVSIKDFSFSANGEYLYGIADGGKLTKINVNSGEVSFIGEAHNGYEFDSSFSDKNGRFFANDSNGNGFFEFNLEDGTKRFLSNSQPADFNDGTNCIDAGLVFTDYGDAPSSYNDAWHNIIGGIYLGDKVDHDTKSYVNDTALGDDSNGTDDEDGVTLLDGTDISGKYFETNSTHSLKVKLSKEAYLQIWIDKDINGHFDNASDLIYNSGVKLSAGVHTINFDLPPNLSVNKKTYLRARVSSSSSMNPVGFVIDGEVEDYMIYFGTGIKPLRGVFNIERTDSGSFPINSDNRNAWFTQIVGRDFDYSLVFYEEDMSSEKELDGVTVKIDLINKDNNKTRYTKYAYIKNTPPKSRIDNLLPNDLNSISATKRAIFKVSYGVDDNGNIIQAPCEIDPKLCFEALPKTTFVYAKDDFAIRPEYFHLILSDNNQTLRVNTSPDNNSSLRLTAGYDYNLTITASTFNGNDNNPSLDYNTTANRYIEFLDKSNPNAIVKSDLNITDTFIDGKSIGKLLEVQEVGRYRLHIFDSDWAKVDSSKGDCDINSSITSANGNIKSGCSISSNPDINLTFYPDHFNVDLTLENLPNSSHNDFIYMSEINSTFNSVAISYSGDITAKSEDNITTKNFVSGYMAEDTLLNLVVTTMSDNGLDQPIVTTKGTPIYFTRVTRFNSETSVIVDRNQTFSNLPKINITKDKFKNDQNGTVGVDLRFNIDKNLSQTINPIQITFHKIDINSTNSYSLSNGKDESNPYIPKGNQNLGNSVRNFYFAQVAPDKIRFPRIYFKNENTLRTPMQIEIFCGNGVTNQYCIDTNITNHIKLESSPRAELGWFLSIDHNATVDGKVTTVVPNDPNPNVLQIKTTKVPTFPIIFVNGRNGTVTTRFTDPHGIKKYRVDIYPEPPLRFNNDNKPPKPSIPKGNPDYTVEGTENNSSTWTGVGDTGNILEMKANSNSAHKMDW